jgi:tellurite resistance protein TehA-like permease
VLPAISLLVASATAPSVAQALPSGSHSSATLIAAYSLLGLGLTTSLVFLGLYLLRLYLYKIPPASSIVAAFIAIGPLNMSASAFVQLGGAATSIWAPRDGLVGAFETSLASSNGMPVAEVARTLGVLLALALWGWGLLWLYLAVAGLLRYVDLELISKKDSRSVSAEQAQSPDGEQQEQSDEPSQHSTNVDASSKSRQSSLTTTVRTSPDQHLATETALEKTGSSSAHIGPDWPHDGQPSNGAGHAITTPKQQACPSSNLSLNRIPHSPCQGHQSPTDDDTSQSTIPITPTHSLKVTAPPFSLTHHAAIFPLGTLALSCISLGSPATSSERATIKGGIDSPFFRVLGAIVAVVVWLLFVSIAVATVWELWSKRCGEGCRVLRSATVLDLERRWDSGLGDNGGNGDGSGDIESGVGDEADIEPRRSVVDSIDLQDGRSSGQGRWRGRIADEERRGGCGGIA